MADTGQQETAVTATDTLGVRLAAGALGDEAAGQAHAHQGSEVVTEATTDILNQAQSGGADAAHLDDIDAISRAVKSATAAAQHAAAADASAHAARAASEAAKRALDTQAQIFRQPSPFVAALRGALGIDAAAQEAMHGGAFGFDAAVEAELRGLFKRCDTDRSGTMGRAEFSKALQILNLDQHLMQYGNDHGLVHGMEVLYGDLDASGDGLVDEQEFVDLFRRLSEKEQQSHPPPPARRGTVRANSSSSDGGTAKSSLEAYEEAHHVKYDSEMTHAKEVLAMYDVPQSPHTPRASLSTPRPGAPSRGRSLYDEDLQRESKISGERDELFSMMKRLASKDVVDESASVATPPDATPPDAPPPDATPPDFLP